MSASSRSRSASQRAGATEPAGFDPAFRARLRDLLLWRRDVRRFRSDPLPGGTLDALIELACLAPSVGLSQPWRFVIVEDAARRAAIQRNFEILQCRGARRAAARTRRSLRATQARRLAGSAMSFCGIRRPRDRARPRPRASHHAGDDRVFGGHRGPYDLARSARPGHRHGLGIDPRSASGRRHSRGSARTGNSSAISVSAIRRPTTQFPSWSKAAGSAGGCRSWS